MISLMVKIPDEEYELYKLAAVHGMGSTAIRRILDGKRLNDADDELIFKKDREEEIEEVLQTLEKLYNDFTMRPDECKALDFAINFIKENK